MRCQVCIPTDGFNEALKLLNGNDLFVNVQLPTFALINGMFWDNEDFHDLL